MYSMRDRKKDHPLAFPAASSRNTVRAPSSPRRGQVLPSSHSYNSSSSSIIGIGGRQFTRSQFLAAGAASLLFVGAIFNSLSYPDTATSYSNLIVDLTPQTVHLPDSSIRRTSIDGRGKDQGYGDWTADRVGSKKKSTKKRRSGSVKKREIEKHEVEEEYDSDEIDHELVFSVKNLAEQRVGHSSHHDKKDEEGGGETGTATDDKKEGAGEAGVDNEKDGADGASGNDENEGGGDEENDDQAMSDDDRAFNADPEKEEAKQQQLAEAVEEKKQPVIESELDAEESDEDNGNNSDQEAESEEGEIGNSAGDVEEGGEDDNESDPEAAEENGNSAGDGAKGGKSDPKEEGDGDGEEESEDFDINQGVHEITANHTVVWPEIDISALDASIKITRNNISHPDIAWLMSFPNRYVLCRY